MPAYRLLCTRRNRDGSFETPSFDVPIEASDDKSAIGTARRFPRSAFGDADIAWLVDGRRIVWSNTGSLGRAA
ncbi:MAG TPA: hypothetical protein VH414_06230 [Lichenihabitans sp.]|jgi:hypothetical protein|nr:hypothetical protein [Lichenihabitans sp.]